MTNEGNFANFSQINNFWEQKLIWNLYRNGKLNKILIIHFNEFKFRPIKLPWNNSKHDSFNAEKIFFFTKIVELKLSYWVGFFSPNKRIEKQYLFYIIQKKSFTFLVIFIFRLFLRVFASSNFVELMNFGGDFQPVQSRICCFRLKI